MWTVGTITQGPWPHAQHTDTQSPLDGRFHMWRRPSRDSHHPWHMSHGLRHGLGLRPGREMSEAGMQPEEGRTLAAGLLPGTQVPGPSHCDPHSQTRRNRTSGKGRWRPKTGGDHVTAPPGTHGHTRSQDPYPHTYQSKGIFGYEVIPEHPARLSSNCYQGHRDTSRPQRRDSISTPTEPACLSAADNLQEAWQTSR